MNKKLENTLKYCNSEQGFAMPIVMGIGLIMLLISATMIVRSQGDQVTASAQKSTTQALSAAETGITRYQSLINNNRLIAMYSRTGTPGWTTASSIPKINTCTGGSAAKVIAAAIPDWQDVDSTNPSKGQYRLIDYTYGPTPGVVPGTGTLTVEGRVNQSGSSSTATAGAGTATTRLVVNIPVINQPSNSVAAGLLLKNVIQNIDRNKIQGNIVVSACSLPSGVSNSNVSDTTKYQAIAEPDIIFPDTPALPDLTKLNTIFPATMDDRIWGETLPKVGDINSDRTAYAAGVSLLPSSPTYSYLINGDLAKSGGADIVIRPNAKVIFYVQGNIDIGGSAEINKDGYPKNLQIYGNTFQRNPDGTIKLGTGILLNKPLTKYGCPVGITLPILLSPVSDLIGYDCPTTSVSLNGGGSINALVHAPDATGSVAGSGGGCDTSTNPPSGGGFIGGVWIKKWDRQSNNAGPMVCAYGNYSDYLGFQQETQPSITSITSWQRQETP